MRNERGSYFRKMVPSTDGGPVTWAVDVVEARRSFEWDATVTDGVVRWMSNGQVPPLGILQHWTDLGLPFDMERSVAVQKRETEAFFSEYRAQQPKAPSAEELYEMRAAFGPGVDVVDVISGRRVRT